MTILITETVTNVVENPDTTVEVQFGLVGGGGGGGGGAPSGPAGGVLAGTYPDPSFAVDMATQAELDAEAAARVAAAAAHVAAADPHTGYRLESALIVSADIQDATIVVGDLAFDPATQAELDAVAAAKQPLDADLTAIAALDASTAGAIASDGAGWIKKTYAQFKTALVLVKGDVGLGSVDNTSDAAKPVSTATQTALDLKQDIVTAGTGMTKTGATLDVGAGSGITVAADTVAADFGSGAGKVTQGNDSRLSDARTPTAHAASHKSGGSDAIKLDELAAPTDVTTLDASTSQHGLLKKLPGGTTDFLRADGAFAPPPGGAPSGAAGGALDGSYPNPGLAAAVAGAGLAETSDVLSVNVDGSTIEINADTLRVKADGITANEIAANAVGASEIAADAVGTSELADNAVDTGAIAASAVTSAEIAANAVKPSHLEDGILRPADYLYVCWTGNPDTVPTSLAPVTRTPYLMKVLIPEDITITDLTIIIGGTGVAGLTAGGNRLGVFNSAGTLLSQSADITAFAANSAVTANLGAPQAITGGVGVFVWLALLVTASTMPTIARHSSGGLVTTVLTNGKLTAGALRCGTLAQVTAGNPLPSSFTPSSGLTASNVPYYLAAA